MIDTEDDLLCEGNDSSDCNDFDECIDDDDHDFVGFEH